MLEYIKKNYQVEPRLNIAFSRDNLPDKTKDRTNVIYLHEYSNIGTHSIVLYPLTNNITYLDSFGTERIPKEIKIFIDKSILLTNTLRIKTYDSVMSGCF